MSPFFSSVPKPRVTALLGWGWATHHLGLEMATHRSRVELVADALGYRPNKPYLCISAPLDTGAKKQVPRAAYVKTWALEALDVAESRSLRSTPLGVLTPSRPSFDSMLTLRLRPALLTSNVQILTGNNESEFTGAHQRETMQTVMAASTMTVAAALGFTRQHRRAFFLQQCLFRHVRRHMLLLDTPSWNVFMFGIFPRLRSAWRTLTRPSMELYAHPLTEEAVADLGVKRHQIKKAGGVEQWLALVAEEVNWLDLPTGASVDGLIFQLQRELVPYIMRRLQTHNSWQRYAFEWAKIFILKSHPHSFYRHKRARSIKRRQTKKLIKRTKYRFWPH